MSTAESVTRPTRRLAAFVRPLRRWAIALATAVALVLTGLVAATPAQAATTRLTVGHRAHFRYFDVTVLSTVMDPDYYGYLVRIKLCVNELPPGSTGGKTRVSWDPWTISTNHGTRHPEVQEDPPPDTFPLPYSSEGQFAVGECAIGWLPFWSVTIDDQITSINYDNSVSNHAKWTPSKKLLTLGQTKKFTYFTVRLTRVDRDDYWFGAKAKVCVRKLPPGSHGGKTTVSWAPWSLSTDHGTIPLAIAQEGVSPWATIFPESKRLRKGQCASGWLPFAAASDVHVSKINYKNSLGNKISWVI